MDQAQRNALRQQRFEELCAAALRAFTGDPHLQFRGGRLYNRRQRVPAGAPHLQVDLERDDFGSFRGAADGIALRLKHSDARLHARLRPQDPLGRLVFDMLEQLRVETLVPEAMPGMAHNLRRRFESWSMAFHHARLTDSDIGVLLYALAQICRARLHGLPVLEQTEDLLEPTRGAIGALLGRDLAGIKRHRRDQAAYAVHALSIAGIIAQSIRAAQATGRVEEVEPNRRNALRRLLFGLEDGDGEGFTPAATGESKVLGEAGGNYRVYTRRYDRELKAEAMVRPQLLRELRRELDRGVSEQGINVPRLARLFASLLAVPRRDGWSFAQEEGHIDGRRLAQLVGSPAERRLFRIERERPHARCLFSILIDCSGSMKRHIKSIAVLTDVLARALEHAEVSTEILGFTTGAWSGGRSYRDWVRGRRPLHPGRLNELSHLVFKDAGTGWRRARPGIAAMLKSDLFREGVDGEAVDWACRRMMLGSHPRRILVVVSDGSPMDSATHLANDEFYLDNHLKQVVAAWEAGGVEIYGLGVGLDLSPYYRRSLAIDISKALTNRVFFEIAELLRGRHRR